MDKYKHVISDYFKDALHALQANNFECDGPLKTNEFTNAICWVLEAMFLHGLKNNDKNFLGLIKNYSHKSLFEQMRGLKQITSDIGKCRSWIRLTLNDTTLEGYMNIIVRDQINLKRWYSLNAYLLDEEQTDIMLTYLQGITTFQYDVVCNSSLLNQWTVVPLQLAGIKSNVNLHWPKSPPKNNFNHRISKSRSIVTSTSVSSFQPITSSSMKTSESCPQKLNNSLSLISDNISQIDDSFQNLEDLCNASTSSLTSDISRPDFADNRILDYYQTVYDVSTNNSDDVSLNDVVMATVSEEEENEKRFDRIVRENLENFPIEYRNDFEVKKLNSDIEQQKEINMHPLDNPITLVEQKAQESESYHNKANKNVGNQEESFAQLLQNYYEPLLATSPMASLDLIFKNLEQSINKEKDSDIHSEMTIPHGLDIYILYTTIPKEKGLVNQNYQCYSCSTSIGMFYGKEKVCTYNLLYYCSECLQRAESCIPYKVIYNWDFTSYRVSNEGLIQLNMLKNRPIINIQKLNPFLYDHVEELIKIRDLRSQLISIRTYLASCKENLISDLEIMSDGRPYLYAHAHLYSMNDLMKVPTKALYAKLVKIFEFGERHILSCPICSQKGFYCELCKSNQVIYPFHANTAQCNVCNNLFHLECKLSLHSGEECPKCLRKQRRSVSISNNLEQTDSDDNHHLPSFESSVNGDCLINNKLRNNNINKLINNQDPNIKLISDKDIKIDMTGVSDTTHYNDEFMLSDTNLNFNRNKHDPNFKINDSVNSDMNININEL